VPSRFALLVVTGNNAGGTSDPGDRYLKVTTQCASSSGPTGGGTGCSWPGANTPSVRSTHTDGSQCAWRSTCNLYCCTS
jgi:hypothetical protein